MNKKNDPDNTSSIDLFDFMERSSIPREVKGKVNLHLVIIAYLTYKVSWHYKI